MSLYHLQLLYQRIATNVIPLQVVAAAARPEDLRGHGIVLTGEEFDQLKAIDMTLFATALATFRDVARIRSGIRYYFDEKQQRLAGILYPYPQPARADALGDLRSPVVGPGAAGEYLDVRGQVHPEGPPSGLRCVSTRPPIEAYITHNKGSDKSNLKPPAAPTRPAQAVEVPSAPAARVSNGPRIRLGGANLSGVDLQGVDFSHADLAGADLSAADLTDADLRGADLTGANLRGARVHGVRWA